MNKNTCPQIFCSNCIFCKGIIFHSCKAHPLKTKHNYYTIRVIEYAKCKDINKNNNCNLFVGV